VRKEPAPLPTPSQQKATAVGKQLAAMAIDDPPEVFIAALPARLIEKGLPGVGLLVHLLLSRFEDHLPYYRLEKIFRERHGVPIARQSMVDWTEQLATWLQPIYREMKAESFACGYLQADETPVRYLDRDEPGRSCQGYLWAFGHPRGNVLFEWRTSRGRDGPEEFLKDFKGKLQTDGYAAYSSLVRERNAPLLAQGKEPELILFACWAHYPKSAIIRSGLSIGPPFRALERIRLWIRMVQLHRAAACSGQCDEARHASGVSASDGSGCHSVLGTERTQGQFRGSVPALGESVPDTL